MVPGILSSNFAVASSLFWPHDEISPAPTSTTLPDEVATGVEVLVKVGTGVEVLVSVGVADGTAVEVLVGLVV